MSVDRSLKELREKAGVTARLDSRTKVDPKDYTKVMSVREETHSKSNYSPNGAGDLWPNTFYLENIDQLKRRTYKST